MIALLTTFHHQNRLLAAYSWSQSSKPSRITQRLQIEQYQLGPGVILPELKQIVTRHVGLVADADKGRKSYALFSGSIIRLATARN